MAQMVQMVQMIVSQVVLAMQISWVMDSAANHQKLASTATIFGVNQKQSGDTAKDHDLSVS